jgi:2,3-bisphosphoglycerate-independent phosphoglycerate mutase
MSVLLFFIDGLGIAARGPQNPLDGLAEAEPLAIFSHEPTTAISDEQATTIYDGTLMPPDAQATIFDGIVVPTDARLGTEGRPQSASGQTTILTGINVPELLGYHKQGFPNSAMLEILREHSIFLQLKHAGIGPITFANTYTQRFFDDRPRWVSATTAAMEAGAVPFRQVADLKVGRAVFHDFTNQLLIERGENVELRSAEKAAEVLASLVSEHKFTLYEYFITDKIGHKQDLQLARTTLQNLARLIREVLVRIDLNSTSVILTSDHGNIEDLSSRNHTLNMVPTIVWGRDQNRIASRIRSLADITPAIVETLTAKAIAREY